MPDTQQLRAAIIAQARARFGIPYGLPPGRGQTDCSLWVRDVYEAAGLPFSPGVRVAEAERQDTVPIDLADVLPGDLLFFERTYDVPGEPGPDGKIASHIGISLGAGTRRMYDANDGRGSSGETNIGTDYWQDQLFEARRHPSLMGAEEPAPVPTEQPWGIDVASHQGAVDWRAVASAGAAFGFTKATGGSWYKNPTLVANWAGMKANDIKRGAYHYAFESSGQPFPGPGPEAEAEHFLNAVMPLGIEPGDMLVLDLEEGNGPLGEWVLRWCQRVEQRTGVVSLIYTGTWFSVPHGLGDVPELARYPLWLAAYQAQMPAPPAPWQTVAFWQHTSSASVPGVAGDCDRNVFNGPADHLKLYGKPGASAPPPPPPGDKDALIAHLRAELAAEREKTSGLVTAVAVLGDDVGDALQAQVDKARAIREQFVGPRPR
jgi:GH25 family lysozyme M1 (1,4-beta-N-acetylmuramidase)